MLPEELCENIGTYLPMVDVLSVVEATNDPPYQRLLESSASKWQTWIEAVEDTTGRLMKYLLDYEVPELFMEDIICLCFGTQAIRPLEEIANANIITGKCCNKPMKIPYKMDSLPSDSGFFAIANCYRRSPIINKWIDTISHNSCCGMSNFDEIREAEKIGECRNPDARQAERIRRLSGRPEYQSIDAYKQYIHSNDWDKQFKDMFGFWSFSERIEFLLFVYGCCPCDRNILIYGLLCTGSLPKWFHEPRIWDISLIDADIIIGLLPRERNLHRLIQNKEHHARLLQHPGIWNYNYWLVAHWTYIRLTINTKDSVEDPMRVFWKVLDDIDKIPRGMYLELERIMKYNDNFQKLLSYHAKVV